MRKRLRAKLEARKTQCDEQAAKAELLGEAYAAMGQTGAATEAYAMATVNYEQATEIERLLTVADLTDSLRRAG